jgi:hypothetical protein
MPRYVVQRTFPQGLEIRSAMAATTSVGASLMLIETPRKASPGCSRT